MTSWIGVYMELLIYLRLGGLQKHYLDTGIVLVVLYSNKTMKNDEKRSRTIKFDKNFRFEFHYWNEMAMTVLTQKECVLFNKKCVKNRAIRIELVCH